MAPRKSASKTEARERARKAAAEAMAREQRLLELGEEFFLAQGEAEQIMDTAEQRITEIRAKAELEAAQSKEAQARVVVAMKGERVAVSDIAQRLELSAAAVRALLKDNTGEDSVTSQDADSADVATPDDNKLKRETVDA
ncbi:hypothetical protein ACT4S5_18595 [Kocuria oceani]|uniref:hypothetical protein n=1 Tax=Kocuria oceani TaxID=988827 RepID=UPI004035B6F3